MKKEEIRHLAELSRIELTDTEVDKYTEQFGDIVKYVDKIKEITPRHPSSLLGTSSSGQAGESEEVKIESAGVSDVFREDDNVQETGIYTDKLLESAPETKDSFVKVKKILKND